MEYNMDNFEEIIKGRHENLRKLGHPTLIDRFIVMMIVKSPRSITPIGIKNIVSQYVVWCNDFVKIDINEPSNIVRLRFEYSRIGQLFELGNYGDLVINGHRLLNHPDELCTEGESQLLIDWVPDVLPEPPMPNPSVKKVTKLMNAITISPEMYPKVGPKIDPEIISIHKSAIEKIIGTTNIPWENSAIKPIVKPLGKPLIKPTAQKLRNKYSKKQILWLQGINNALGIPIQHAENGGEYRVRDMEMGGSYLLDGFAQVGSKKIAFEFDGCLWHGCIKCHQDLNEINKITKKQFGQHHEDTLHKASALTRLGFTLITIKECDYDEMIKKQNSGRLRDYYCELSDLIWDSYYV